ncbi:hypothetical protein FRC05_004720 [Tulasnella sp. 425]|nr:hypothetical protein FRC05_004720 [Tulasnella sp. 425]
MVDERDPADIPRSTESNPSGSRSEFKLSAKLRARMEKLKKWRISPSSIKAPKDARRFHGGHATVSKAFLLDSDRYDMWFWGKSYSPREVLQLCRQSSESDEPIRGAADHRRDAEEELDDEGKDEEQEYGIYHQRSC